MRSFEQLTTATETTSWIPADAYADLILEASVAYGELSGVITAVNHDMQACEGKIIQVRSVPARTAQALTGTGITDCLSSTSTTPTTYSITVGKYGDYDTMPGFSLFQTCGPIKEAILREMAKGLARKRDEVIFDEITVFGVPSCSQSMTSALKCFSGYPNWKTSPVGSGSIATAIWGNAINLWDTIVHGVASMRYNAGKAYEPDYLILNPNVAAFLKVRDDWNVPAGIATIDPVTGKLIRFAGLKVIETPHATGCLATSGATMAVIIDSKRACGEAWGMKPKYTEVYEPECDYYKEVLFMYWGAAEMDRLAICHIRNP